MQLVHFVVDIEGASAAVGLAGLAALAVVLSASRLVSEIKQWRRGE